MTKDEAIALQNTFSVLWRQFLNEEGARHVLSEVQVTGLYHVGNDKLRQVLAQMVPQEEPAAKEEEGKEYGADLDLDDIIVKPAATT